MEKEIIELVEKYKQLVSNQDRQLFDDVFSSSTKCSLISITKIFEGRESIYQDFLIDIIQAAYEKIDLISESISINPINDNEAIVIFGYHTECIKRDHHELYGIQGLETQIVQKENNQWKLVHVHYSK